MPVAQLGAFLNPIGRLRDKKRHSVLARRVSTFVQMRLFERRRPRVGRDSHKRQLADWRSGSARPDVIYTRDEKKGTAAYAKAVEIMHIYMTEQA